MDDTVVDLRRSIEAAAHPTGRWVPPPPPPPPSLTAGTRRIRLRLRPRRGLVIELAAAAVILAALAALAARTSTPAPTPVAQQSSPLASWERDGVPAITALIQDITTAERDTEDPPNASAAALTADAGHLAADVSAASRLPAPPGSADARLWRSSLSQLAGARGTLVAATGTLSPAAVAVAHQQLAAAGAGLLQIGQALTTGG